MAMTGGKGGGGVALTKFGEQLIKSYRALERDIARASARRMRRIVPAVIEHAAANAASVRRPLTRKHRQKAKA